MHDTTPDPFHADFEAAVTKVYDEAGADEPNLVFKHGAYTDPLIQSAWWAWNASRDALVVDLPATYRFEGCDYCDAGSVRDMIEDIGLKVAP